MDIGVIGQKTLLVGMPEVGAVVDGSLFTWSTAEDFGTPRVAEKESVIQVMMSLATREPIELFADSEALSRRRVYAYWVFP